MFVNPVSSNGLLLSSNVSVITTVIWEIEAVSVSKDLVSLGVALNEVIGDVSSSQGRHGCNTHVRLNSTASPPAHLNSLLKGGFEDGDFEIAKTVTLSRRPHLGIVGATRFKILSHQRQEG